MSNTEENEPREIALAVAGTMLKRARVVDTIDRVCTLANDVRALALDEFDGDCEAAARELQSRIGGLDNLQSYSNCLLIGARKRGEIC